MLLVGLMFNFLYIFHFVELNAKLLLFLLRIMYRSSRWSLRLHKSP